MKCNQISLYVFNSFPWFHVLNLFSFHFIFLQSIVYFFSENTKKSIAKMFLIFLLTIFFIMNVFDSCCVITYRCDILKDDKWIEQIVLRIRNICEQIHDRGKKKKRMNKRKFHLFPAATECR